MPTGIATLLAQARRAGITIQPGPNRTLAMRADTPVDEHLVAELRARRDEIADHYTNRCWRCRTDRQPIIRTYYGHQTCEPCAIKAVALYDRTNSWPPHPEDK